MRNDVTFRFATKDDSAEILAFVRALAEYEHLSDQVVATEEILQEWVFDKKGAEVLFVSAGGKDIGYALFFCNFSTFLGRSGLYIEDLFVYPEYRGRGYGRALFTELARIAAERGCGRMEWACLDWNRPSIDFYLSAGAEPLTDWTIYRLSGDRLHQLAADAL